MVNSSETEAWLHSVIATNASMPNTNALGMQGAEDQKHLPHSPQSTLSVNTLIRRLQPHSMSRQMTKSTASLPDANLAKDTHVLLVQCPGFSIPRSQDFLCPLTQVRIVRACICNDHLYHRPSCLHRTGLAAGLCFESLPQQVHRP